MRLTDRTSRSPSPRRKTAKNATVFEDILRFNADRKRQRVQLKLARIDENPFCFFRGTDHLFAAAWKDLKPAEPGPDIWISGDLHLENFGAYQSDDGIFRYDINDFDEAVVAPCSFDLCRCVASILLAADAWQLPAVQAAGMALAFLEQYRNAVAAAARHGIVGEITPGGGRGVVWDLLAASRSTTAAGLLERHTRMTEKGKRRIACNPDKYPEISPGRASRIRAAVERYGRTAIGSGSFRVLDATGRIAGIGSLGLRRYLVLVQYDDDPNDARLLDIKEARASTIRRCAAPGIRYPNGARRVVYAQRLLQARPVAGLDVLRITGRWYRIREIIPEENRSSLDRLLGEPDKLRLAVETAGRLTGWSQVRGCRVDGEDRIDLLSRWTSGTALETILSAAGRFADRTRKQYEEYHRAYAASCSPR